MKGIYFVIKLLYDVTMQVLVLERGYAPSIPVEDAQKLPRMGRWSFLRLSGGMVDEILNTEPEKVCGFICIEIHSLKKCTFYV